MTKSLVQDLRAFGLSEWEARSYVALATRGSLTAAALSAASKIPVSKIYEVLRNLQRKSLAALRATKPYRWCAVEPAAALRSILENKQAATAALEAKTAELLTKLKPTMEKGKAEMWTATGKRAFFDKFTEMLGRANSECCVVTSKFTRTASIDSEIKAALGRGVKIRMIGTSKLNKGSDPRAAWYANTGVSIRLLQLDAHPVIGLTEGKEAVIRIDGDEESDYIWSNHPALVEITKNFFENLWARAKPIAIK